MTDMLPPPFPDPEFYDRQTGTYLFVGSYTTPHGSRCTVEVWAEDWQDAEEHMEMLRRTLTLDGQVYRRQDVSIEEGDDGEDG
jgi:hypothetical protein